jgi:hypothetical protein
MAVHESIPARGSSPASPIRNVFAWVFLIALSVASVPVYADALQGRPDPDLGPTLVDIEIYVLDLDKIDSAAQSFDANVYFEAIWRDPRLAVEADTATRRLDQVWHPRLQILNQQRLWSSLPDEVTVDPDGTVTQRARVWGSFSQPLDLREFPFDRQTINIPVVAVGFGPDKVVLSASSKSGIGDTFSIADWRIVDWRMIIDYPIPGPEDDQAAGIAMALEVERLKGFFVLKVIVPLVLIVAMSWAVFWIDPADMGTRISITITAMLTLIAYRFSISASLPNISYLTRMDLFILFSTIFIYASLLALCNAKLILGRLCEVYGGSSSHPAMDY